MFSASNTESRVTLIGTMLCDSDRNAKKLGS